MDELGDEDGDESEETKETDGSLSDFGKALSDGAS